MDCIFCKIAKKEIPSKIITETNKSIAFLDAFPLSRGHTLVIPKCHYKKVQGAYKWNTKFRNKVRWWFWRLVCCIRVEEKTCNCKNGFGFSYYNRNKRNL